MQELDLPDLTLPVLNLGPRQVPLDLRILLYRGGAAAHADNVNDMIQEGKLGSPLLARLPLVSTFHEQFRSRLAAGGSSASARSVLILLRYFYTHADTALPDLTEVTLKDGYVSWVAHLHQLQRLKKLMPLTVYKTAVVIGKLVSDTLGLTPRALRRFARVHKPRCSRRVVTGKADKQNLTDTFAFGHTLLDIADALSPEAIRGELPVSITFRTGQVLKLWGHLGRYADSTSLKASADMFMHHRHPLLRLRVEAELLIFLAQTSMNLAQARLLKVGSFSYQSHHNGYLVSRIYKARRRGEVEFEIFSEYRPVFERYLEWRNDFFAHEPEGWLFPFVQPKGRPSRPSIGTQLPTRKLCSRLGVAFVCPRILRQTRLNWVLRRSKDPTLTAEMAQHSRETLLRVYEQPSHQIAMVEASRYFQQSDPHLKPPSAGACVRNEPAVVPGTATHAPQPDCVSPSGCLFCVHHRDVDSFDFVWSLSSYRYLKSLEQARYPQSPRPVPGQAALPVIDRVTEKLHAFAASSPQRAAWTQEAQARVDEGEHHPQWDGFIQLSEMSQ